ncbi:hypothetical protein ACFYO0_44805 [Streptomyces sp. NPDC006365]
MPAIAESGIAWPRIWMKPTPEHASSISCATLRRSVSGPPST